jgi:hypothetical protein
MSSAFCGLFAWLLGWRACRMAGPVAAAAAGQVHTAGACMGSIDAPGAAIAYVVVPGAHEGEIHA